MNNNSSIKHQIVRTVVVMSIILIIAAIHIFRLGSYLNGNLQAYYYGYASDVMIPFGVYFLLCLNEIHIQFLRKWYVKALIVFGAMSFSEIMQYFGIYFFGDTFDWLDILMFAIGVCVAVCFDNFLLKKFVPNWKYSP